MDFSSALLELKLGKPIARATWGRGAFLAVTPANPAVPAANIWSAPNRAYAEALPGQTIAVDPTLTMAIDGRIVMGVSLYAADVIAEDWFVVEAAPLQYECSIAPQVVNAGDPITVTGTATNLLPSVTPEYTFASTGGMIVGTGNVVNIDTAGLAEGWYTVKGHVSDGVTPSRMADCEVQFCVGNSIG